MSASKSSRRFGPLETERCCGQAPATPSGGGGANYLEERSGRVAEKAWRTAFRNACRRQGG
ncbi:MAG: hypothetical protein BGP09_29400 [Rhizobium sp. 60-20]|nr:MAG: hypothetical protein BGP09_29400 [Rhizobium sp. 60-20]